MINVWLLILIRLGVSCPPHLTYTTGKLVSELQYRRVFGVIGRTDSFLVLILVIKFPARRTAVEKPSSNSRRVPVFFFFVRHLGARLRADGDLQAVLRAPGVDVQQAQVCERVGEVQRVIVGAGQTCVSTHLAQEVQTGGASSFVMRMMMLITLAVS